MPKHYRPPGKKREGNSAKYITRTKAIHYLQINLSSFRKLCILKGIFPREPKKKLEGNDKTYYHMKDIMFLAHEPLLEKFREIRAYDKKIKRALAKKNKDEVARLEKNRPSYTLDHLVKERYPQFVDALRDLDDCLTMIHLFAALPAVESERINVNRIHNCRRLSHEWQAYISRTHSLRKTFISVKGIYYQAEVQGQKITWLTPHALQQVIPDDVDFNVMLTFLEFYETLLAFANFKLYHSINVKYPPTLDPRLEALAADLYALSRYLAASSRTLLLDNKAIVPSESEQVDGGQADRQPNETDVRLALLQNQLPANESSSLTRLVVDVIDEDEDDMETRECKALFKNLKIFLSREVPRESLLFVIPAFGGVVGWDGDGSPIKESDESITHQIVDRPTQPHMFLSRDYVQPQWVYDCVNSLIIIPTENYLIGRVAPPHLSPFVDNEAEGYVPEYAETIKRLQAAYKKQLLPMPDLEQQDIDDPKNLFIEGVINRSEDTEASQRKREREILEKQYHNELKIEMQGVTCSASVPLQGNTLDEDIEGSIPQPDHAPNENENLSKSLMSRKKRKLYEAMQIGKARKRADIELLKERKKKADKQND
ncbi:pescadillo homolog isoform X1 [Amborella trichopoda]|uniref:Pescadillo homolog n=2 Tax=Amborella trichopoda TaxID=13333 RepID=W1NTH7_AMBTC|nr:pescadillo homolog isoform X1 [Amborella trichopoda]XP_011620502.1 pescadillo homolog isoform X1 [Amborella trichopoda]ERM98465.1 hypothetical protein AMTR_s00072p00157670 [Amborella trichopoda]|eukprot:XP_006833187.1 pescadillo homolog isoform X1 [Amborella trichopoda]